MKKPDEFEQGILHAAALMVQSGVYEERIVTDLLRMAGLADADVSECNDFIQDFLREVNGIDGIRLTGFPAKRTDQGGDEYLREQRAA